MQRLADVPARKSVSVVVLCGGAVGVQSNGRGFRSAVRLSISQLLQLRETNSISCCHRRIFLVAAAIVVLDGAVSHLAELAPYEVLADAGCLRGSDPHLYWNCPKGVNPAGVNLTGAVLTGVIGHP